MSSILDLAPARILTPMRRQLIQHLHLLSLVEVILAEIILDELTVVQEVGSRFVWGHKYLQIGGILRTHRLRLPVVALVIR